MSFTRYSPGATRPTPRRGEPGTAWQRPAGCGNGPVHGMRRGATL
ncbi:hypothetical protein [Diaphorobacter ruginosibacter]|nr:hypothetical protein [Diaphorobacter ruginosibacter]